MLLLERVSTLGIRPSENPPLQAGKDTPHCHYKSKMNIRSFKYFKLQILQAKAQTPSIYP